MHCQRQSDGSVLLRHINAFEYNTFWELQSLADPADHLDAKNRLYPPPYLKSEASEETRNDWDEFVRTELELQLGASMTNVLADLDKAIHETTGETTEDEDGEDDDEAEEEESKAPPTRWTFTIPAEHVEDWFRAMNAARLVMSQRYESHRTDFNYVVAAVNSGSTSRLVQYELLTSLCDWWLQALMR